MSEKEEKKGTKKEKKAAKVSKDKQKIQALEAQIESLESQVTEEKDHAVRNLAELENFKKRKQQEVDTFKKYASESAIIELLPALDSIDMALTQYQSQEGDFSAMIEGLELIKKQFLTSLEKCHVVSLDGEGDPFDPNLHQAISQVEKEGVDSDTVVQVVQKGYKLHDRVIRPAMVIVSK